jgi:3-hydroxyacyl-CoA dehydrogenase/enoyl-CoA hydratase/3-hydroxybutyryl-CoA epimerase
VNDPRLDPGPPASRPGSPGSEHSRVAREPEQTRFEFPPAPPAAGPSPSPDPEPPVAPTPGPGATPPAQGPATGASEPPPTPSAERTETAASRPSPHPGVRMVTDETGIGWITFDLPGKPVNLLTTPVMEALRELLDDAARKGTRGLVFVSEKPGTFIAGADVEEIAGIQDAREGAAKAAYGQAIFETVARFPRPTVALITGACVGGGYELALACRYRVAEDLPEVTIGLPEVKLGILPGFGGTQRLPRRIGLPAALDLILAGKTLPARAAARRGMVDLVVPPGLGADIAAEIVLGKRVIRPARPPRWARLAAAIPPARALLTMQARRALESKVSPDHYPSPYMALAAATQGFGMREVDAYRNEARLLANALVTEAGRSLVGLYRAHQRAKEPQGLPLDAARPTRRLAVVGAGVMGGGIAWLAAEHGKPIRIKDVAPAPLSGALKTAGALWGKQVARRRLTPRERDRRLERLSFTLDDSGFDRVDLVFEAVVENLEIKREVVAGLERVLPAESVIATNTSSLRIDAIAAGARRPERIVGLHFFNPVPRMPLVEVVAGSRSAPWAIASAYRLALDLGKTPVLVQDGPGFLVNRLLAFYLGEALDLLGQGADIERVDDAMEAFGMPMGPFELLDQIGLDVAVKVTHVLGEAFGDRLPAQVTLGRLVEEGRLGKKSGGGFYDYRGDRAGGPSQTARRAAGNPEPRTPHEDHIQDRLLLPMVNEAARILEEKLVSRAQDVDLGLVLGTGFPPFRGGLLRWADRRGVRGIVTRLESLAAAVSRRYEPSAALRGIENFYPVDSQ